MHCNRFHSTLGDTNCHLQSRYQSSFIFTCNQPFISLFILGSQSSTCRRPTRVPPCRGKFDFHSLLHSRLLFISCVPPTSSHTDTHMLILTPTITLHTGIRLDQVGMPASSLILFTHTRKHSYFRGGGVTQVNFLWSDNTIHK